VRVVDPIGGLPDLDRYFRDYEQYFGGLKYYSGKLRRLMAGYSRGDDPVELRRAFSVVITSVAAVQHELEAKGERETRVFAHQGKFAGPFRDALVLLSFGLCLRAPRSELLVVLNNSERGDPLIETIAGAACADLAQPLTQPAFYWVYDGLYDALARSGDERERSVGEYLERWYVEKMVGFAFKDEHLQPDASGYVGYWCFEAAGVVAALAIDAKRFALHPHYPKDLAAFALTS